MDDVLLLYFLHITAIFTFLIFLFGYMITYNYINSFVYPAHNKCNSKGNKHSFVIVNDTNKINNDKVLSRL